ncbi:hypothetical protein Vafri_12350 [Volvox africanus]|nr:hypothetical protein Vafri_12350 [Volvox africanus]
MKAALGVYVNMNNCYGLAGQAAKVAELVLRYRDSLTGKEGLVKECFEHVLVVIKKVEAFVVCFSQTDGMSKVKRVLRVVTAKTTCEALSRELVGAMTALKDATHLDMHEGIQALANRAFEEDAEGERVASALRAAEQECGGIDKLADRLAQDDGYRQKLFQELYKSGGTLLVANLQSILLEKVDDIKKIVEGPPINIRHPLLQVFWTDHFRGKISVEWGTFWDAFPNRLNTPDKPELVQLLQQHQNREAFQVAIEDGRNIAGVSVEELSAHFEEHTDLLTKAKALVMEGLHRITPASCRVHQPVDHFRGRSKELQELRAFVDSDGPRDRCLVISGDIGLGKAELAYKACEETVRAGLAPGGTFQVYEDTIAAGPNLFVSGFLDAFGCPAGQPPGMEALRTRLNQLANAAGSRQPRMLLLIDHADNVLQHDGGKEKLDELLKLALRKLPGLKVIITCRKDPALAVYEQYPPKLFDLQHGLGLEESVEVLEALCPALARDRDQFREILQDVASKVNGVPRMLLLVGLYLNRKEPQQLPEELRTVANSFVNLESDGGFQSLIAAQVFKAVMALSNAERQDLLCLCLFPSAFTDEAVEKVLDAEDRLAGLERLRQAGLVRCPSDATYEVQVVIRNGCRAMLENRRMLRDLKLDYRVLMDDAQRFLLEYARQLQSISFETYITSAAKAFRLAQKEKHNIEQALRLPRLFSELTMQLEMKVWPPELSKACCDPLVGMMMQLPIVNVYDAFSVKAIVQELRMVFRQLKHQAGQVACTVVESWCRWQIGDAKQLDSDYLGKVLEKVNDALSNSTGDERLLQAGILGLRSLGCIARKLRFLDTSVEHLERARKLLKNAPAELKNAKWFKIEEILVNIELSGALDYMGQKGIERGLEEVTEDGTRLVEQLFVEGGQGDSRHPLRALSYEKKGYVLKALGKHEEAIEAHRNALDIRMHVFGKAHVEVATSLNQIGLSFAELKGFDGQAEEALLEALRIRRTTLGSDHEWVANVQVHLGKLYQRRGDCSKAEAAFRDAIQIYEDKGLSKRAAEPKKELDRVLAQHLGQSTPAAAGGGNGAAAD